MKHTYLTAFIIASMLALGGCGGVAKTLGIGKQPGPDEFQVLTKAPLSLPPDYTLRPPAPGEQRPQDATPQTAAKQSVFEISTDDPTGPVFKDSEQSNIEQLLLMKSDAEIVDPNIRQKVNQEAGQLKQVDKSTIDQILFWKDQHKDTVVDPVAEQQRIQTNQDEGKPVNEGDVEVIENRNRGVLELLD